MTPTGSNPAWDEVVDSMLAETAAAAPRAETYWAQQLAFGPVFVHAVLRRHERRPLRPSEVDALRRCAHLAREALGALPDLPGGDPVALRVLAQRQARALSWRRRAALNRLLRALGEEPPETETIAPSRMVRPYPLIGFRPGERLEG